MSEITLPAPEDNTVSLTGRAYQVLHEAAVQVAQGEELGYGASVMAMGTGKQNADGSPVLSPAFFIVFTLPSLNLGEKLTANVICPDLFFSLDYAKNLVRSVLETLRGARSQESSGLVLP